MLYSRPPASTIPGIIFSTFQGHLRQEQQQIVVRPDTESNAKPQFDIDRGKRWTTRLADTVLTFPMLEMRTTASPFLFLAVDLPPPPLFQDAVEKNIIPQVSIYSILAKFDGVTAQVSRGSIPGPVIHDQHLPGKCRNFETIQVSTTPTVYHSQLQTVHQEHICGREESDDRQLPAPRA